jgi:hypothetical protein
MKPLPNFRQDRSGAVLPYIAVTLLTLIICLAISIDLSRTFLVRSKAMAALDAAVLAAAAEIGNIPVSQLSRREAIISEKGREYFQANFPNGYLGVSYADSQPQIIYDETTERVTGQVDMSLPMMFGAFLSETSLETDGLSEVQREGTPLAVEIGLVLDVTPSMCQLKDYTGDGAPMGCHTSGTGENLFNFQSQCITKPGTRLQSLRDALDEFQGKLASATAPGRVRGTPHRIYVGATFFDSYIKLEKGTDNLLPETLHINPLRWDGSRGFYKYWEEGLPASVGLKPYEKSMPIIKSRIDDKAESWVPFMQCPAETQTQVGTWGGFLLLDPSPDSTRLFNHERIAEDPSPRPAPFGTKDTVKVLVLMTDGQNTRWGWDPTIAPDGDYVAAPDPSADAQQEKFCESLKKDAGFVIYSIVMGKPSGPIRNIFRECATNGGNGYYFEPDNGDELEAAFVSIADSIINLRITK